jgi:hypothetical protein
MDYNVNYQDTTILRNNGVMALRNALGDDGARQFLALFNYYEISVDSDELLKKDYTEWRKMQSYNNETDIEEVFTYFKNNPDRPWKRDSIGGIQYTDNAM